MTVLLLSDVDVIDALSATSRKPFWSDVDGGTPKILRWPGRVMIGNAVGVVSTRGGPNFTFLPSAAEGPNWAARDSDFAVMSVRGTLAITGISRTSDKAGISPAPSSWGLGGFIINDAAGAFGRSLYLEAQRESGAGGTPFFEAISKNKGSNVNATPYSGLSGADGAWFVAGGDKSYGGAPLAPSNMAIWIRSGSWASFDPNYVWNKGILFDKYSLTGTDGSDGDTGEGTMISAAKQHLIEWVRPNGNRGSFIKGAVANAGLGGGIRFQGDQTLFTDAGGTIAAGIMSVANGVNYANLRGGAAGSPVVLEAVGADADVPIRLLPKGAAGVRYKADVLVAPFGTTLSAASSGRLITNEGAAALAPMILPPATVGLFFDFYVQDAEGIRVVAPGSNTIRVEGSVSVAGGRIDNATVGSFVRVIAINSTEWITVLHTGTWLIT